MSLKMEDTGKKTEPIRNGHLHGIGKTVRKRLLADGFIFAVCTLIGLLFPETGSYRYKYCNRYTFWAYLITSDVTDGYLCSV